jgi:hypothetical protein
MESQFGDEEVLSARLEKRVKMAITFDQTIGLHLNFCTSFLKLFSLGLIWNPNSVTRRSCRPDLSNGSKRP